MKFISKVFFVITILFFSNNCYSQFIPSCDSLVYLGKETISNEFHKNKGQGRFVYLRVKLTIYSDSTFRKISWDCRSKKCKDKTITTILGTWQKDGEELRLIPNNNSLDRVIYNIESRNLREKSRKNPNIEKRPPNYPVIEIQSLPEIKELIRQKDCA